MLSVFACGITYLGEKLSIRSWLAVYPNDSNLRKAASGREILFSPMVKVIDQGEFSRLSIFRRVQALILQYYVETYWHFRAMRVSKKHFFHGCRIARKPFGLVWRILFNLPKSRELFIERTVTRKHIDCLKLFLAQSQHTHALIFESDALVLENDGAEFELETISNLLDVIASSETFEGREVYLNLSGQDPRLLGLDQVPTILDGVGATLPPASNTSCCYVVDKNLARLALDFIQRNQFTLNLGIDWVWNLFLMDKASNPLSLHVYPPLIEHGSVTGATESWNPKRISPRSAAHF